MQQFVQAVQAGQLDPNMTVGQLAEQLMGQGQEQAAPAQPQGGLGQMPAPQQGM